MIRPYIYAAISPFMRLLGYKKITLTFDVQPRNNGRHFLVSPELPGFSLMLEADDMKDLRSMTNAIWEPLSAYLQFEKPISVRPAPAKKPVLSGFHGAVPGSDKVVADLCYV